MGSLVFSYLQRLKFFFIVLDRMINFSTQKSDNASYNKVRKPSLPSIEMGRKKGYIEPNQ